MGFAKKVAAVANKITAWSYSRWRDYEQCPLKAKFKHVDKLKEPGSPAMERGSAIHELAEHFLKGLLRVLPKELKSFGEFFKALKKKMPEVEQDWAFTKAWLRTGWFDADAWCRVKVDACSYDAKTKRLRIIDHKTGKINEEHLDQLSLYALAGFLLYPDAIAADTELWYLDHPVATSGTAINPVRKEFLPAQVPALKKDWEKRTKAMLADTKFAPRPNNKCRWCHYRASNGGPCKF